MRDRRFVRVKTLVALTVAGLSIFYGAALAGAEPGFAPIAEIPVPSGASPTESPVGSISCPTPTTCTAVGVTQSGAPFAVTETSGIWGTPQLIELPAGAISGTFAITCPSKDNCLAAGSYETSSGAVMPSLVEESSGVWGEATTVTPPLDALTGTFEQAYLVTPWCASAGNCEVVGVYLGSTWELMAATERAGRWTTSASLGKSMGPVIDTGGRIGGGFTWTCTSLGNCVIVSDTEALRQIHGCWGSPITLSDAGLPQNSGFEVAGVGCTTASNCIAVGRVYEVFSYQRPIWWAATVTESSGTWGSPELGQGALSDYSAISCLSTQCVVTGDASSYSDFDSYNIPLAVTWSNGVWSSPTLESIPLPGSNTNDSSSFGAVSCPDLTQCVAVGEVADYVANSGPYDLYPFSTVITADSMAGSPGAPTDVVATPQLGGASVSWSPPMDDGGAAIAVYTATASPNGPTCTTTSTSCSLTGLVNGRQYVVIVTDTNGSATSSRAFSSNFFAGAVPSTPTTVRMRSLKHGVSVTWHASMSPSGEPVLRYSVDATSGSQKVTCFATATSCTLHSLVHARTYRISVSGYDVTGWSLPATVKYVAP